MYLTNNIKVTQADENGGTYAEMWASGSLFFPSVAESSNSSEVLQI